MQSESIRRSTRVADVLANASAIPNVAIIGALNNSDIIPLGASYKRFTEAVPQQKCKCIEVRCGHLQFAEGLSGLQKYACATGPASDFEVQELAASIAAQQAFGQESIDTSMSPEGRLNSCRS